MAAENSSRGKPTKKADTRIRSTSSSITGKTAGENAATRDAGQIDSVSEGCSVETWTEPVLLRVPEQKLLLEHLQTGMSPALACATIGVSLEAARLTLAVDVRFQRRCSSIPDTLTENVRAAIYSRAIRGIVPAQTLWLKEESARKASQQSDEPLTPDELLLELERLSAVLRSLLAGENLP